MPFGYLKRMLFRSRGKKAMTRSSTLPEINLASPIYIVIDEHNEENAGNGEGNEAGELPQINHQVYDQPELTQNTPPSPSKGSVGASDVDDESGYDGSNENRNESWKNSTQLTEEKSTVAAGLFATNLLATRFLSQSASNVSETNWQDDHRWAGADGNAKLSNQGNLVSSRTSMSGSLLQLPGSENEPLLHSAHSDNALNISGGRSGSTALIARRVAGKSQTRQNSWRKTWSRSFKKNILGLDDPDDPEAARLKKYRTRRKRYGGKHFIIALYQCSPPKKETTTALNGTEGVLQESVNKNENNPEDGENSTDQDLENENETQVEPEKEPDTFCAEMLDELNFESRNDPTRLLPPNVTERHREKLKKTLANFFYCDLISESIAFNYFVSDLNNEVKEFINMRYPFVLVFYHEEELSSVHCTEVVKVLKSISHDYNLFKINVLSDMVFGTRNNEEKKLSLNMPYVYIFGKDIEKSDKIIYHEDCKTCELLELIMQQRNIEALQLNDKGELYERIMHNKCLRNNFFHTALITYNLVMCGLYAPVEGMMGRKSNEATAPDGEAEDEYISD